jgi:6 kDa early secretory antigenic target
MNDIMRVEFGALQHASDSIATALNALERQLDQIERDAAPLVQTWEGSAQAAYHERQARWRRSADQLAVMLRDIKVALDESAVDYLRTEQRNESLFGAR